MDSIFIIAIVAFSIVIGHLLAELDVFLLERRLSKARVKRLMQVIIQPDEDRLAMRLKVMGLKNKIREDLLQTLGEFPNKQDRPNGKG